MSDDNPGNVSHAAHARLSAGRAQDDTLMDHVRETLIARGELTAEQVDAWLYVEGDGDAQQSYEQFIAPAINDLEDTIKSARA